MKFNFKSNCIIVLLSKSNICDSYQWHLGSIWGEQICNLILKYDWPFGVNEVFQWQRYKGALCWIIHIKQWSKLDNLFLVENKTGLILGAKLGSRIKTKSKRIVWWYKWKLPNCIFFCDKSLGIRVIFTNLKMLKMRVSSWTLCDFRILGQRCSVKCWFIHSLLWDLLQFKFLFYGCNITAF